MLYLVLVLSFFTNSAGLFQIISSSKPPKVVAVTGASGLLGEVLVKALESKNYSVRRLTSSSKAGENVFNWTPGSKDKEGFVNPEALEGVGAVIHLAGENIASGDSSQGPFSLLGRWTEAKKEKILVSRTSGTKTIVTAISKLKKKPSTLICASAVGYYGYTDSQTTFTEASIGKGEGFLADVCDAWEKEASKSNGTRNLSMRFSVILSEKGGVVGKLLPLFSLGAGGNFGSGKQAFSWVSVDDAAAAIIFALENQKLSGAVNVCSPNPVTNEIFTQALAKALNRPAVFPLPEFAGRLLFGQFGEETILGGQKVVPQKLIKNGFKFVDEYIFDTLKSLVQRK
jgi:uncharacterized protein (TIGR01777 family)